MSEKTEAPIITDPEQVKVLDWEVPGAEFDPEDHDSSFNITRSFESLNNVILDGPALRYFKANIEEYYKAK
jgi:hypothetical protein